MIVDIEPISLGISLAAIVAFIAPIYFSKKKHTRLLKFLQNTFMEEAKREGLLIEEFDFWRNTYAIGIDYGKHKLLFMTLGANTEFELISTDNISFIDLQKQSHYFGKGSKKVEVIDKLALIIHRKGETSERSYLCFFDGEKNSDLSGEWPLIQKWNSILSKEMAISKLKVK